MNTSVTENKFLAFLLLFPLYASNISSLPSIGLHQIISLNYATRNQFPKIFVPNKLNNSLEEHKEKKMWSAVSLHLYNAKDSSEIGR
jgi:hypothetical protein